MVEWRCDANGKKKKMIHVWMQLKPNYEDLKEIYGNISGRNEETYKVR